MDHPFRVELLRLVAASCTDDLLITVRIQAIDTIVHINPAPLILSEALTRYEFFKCMYFNLYFGTYIVEVIY